MSYCATLKVDWYRGAHQPDKPRLLTSRLSGVIRLGALMRLVALEAVHGGNVVIITRQR